GAGLARLRALGRAEPAERSPATAAHATPGRRRAVATRRANLKPPCSRAGASGCRRSSAGRDQRRPVPPRPEPPLPPPVPDDEPPPEDEPPLDEDGAGWYGAAGVNGDEPGGTGLFGSIEMLFGGAGVPMFAVADEPIVSGIVRASSPPPCAASGTAERSRQVSCSACWSVGTAKVSQPPTDAPITAWLARTAGSRTRLAGHD